jgi:hypothetical protein
LGQIRTPAAGDNVHFLSVETALLLYF